MSMATTQATSTETAEHRGCPVDVDHYIVPGTGGHGRARADGLLAVTRAFGCRTAVYGYDATRNDKFLIMTATRSVLDALEILLPSIAAQMEQAARDAVTGYATLARRATPELASKAQRRILVTQYFRAFLRGYGTAAAETISTRRTAVIRASGPELASILTATEPGPTRRSGAISRTASSCALRTPVTGQGSKPARRPDVR